jgi:transposase
MKKRQHYSNASIPNLTMGIDLGDRRSRIYVVDVRGERVAEGWASMTREGLSKWLGKYPDARVVMEAGTHSPWVSRLAKEGGHETFVANPSELYGRKRRKRRNDKLDAEKLARVGRADPALLYPIQHRGEEAQADLAVLRSRDQLVQARTQLITHVRNSVKSIGDRLPKCDTDVFARRMRDALPALLRPALDPVVEQIAALTEAIDAFDRTIERELERKYPETERLRQVKGVGSLTAMAYVLVLEDPKRFPRVREAGSYVGLVPRLDETGESQPQLRITKAGDELVRRYLVQAAHYILGPFGPDTDLRRWGMALFERGGKNAKKRAAVAVARKLSVLLMRLWASGTVYEPLRSARVREQARESRSVPREARENHATQPARQVA